jgi:hypothetical protein
VNYNKEIIKQARKLFLFTIIIICFLQNLSFAQSKTSWEFGLSLGLSEPVLPGDFPDNWKTGTVFSAEAGYTFYFGDILYTIYGRYQNSSFAFDRTKLSRMYTKVQGHPSTLWDIIFGGKIGHVKFPAYLRFGMGFFRLIRDDIKYTDSGSTEILDYESKAGILIDFGIGSKKKISKKVSIFIEAYGYLAEAFKENTAEYYSVISAGGVGIKTGVMWEWGKNGK